MTENRYAKIINEVTHEVQVGVGCPDEYYIEIGMTLMDVELSYNGRWYVAGYAPIIPEPTPPTHDEQSEKREQAYKDEVDGITAHIQRLRDKEQTPEIVAKIEQLIAERDAKVEEIEQRYPYPTDPVTESEENADTQD